MALVVLVCLMFHGFSLNPCICLFSPPSNGEESQGQPTGGGPTFWVGAAAAATLVDGLLPRPPIMRFVTPVDVRFPSGESDIAVGVEAAFFEANQTGVLGTTKIVHEVIDAMAALSLDHRLAYDTTLARAFYQQHGNFTQEDFFGFVGASTQSSWIFDLLHRATPNFPHYPFFGARVFRNTLDVRAFVNLRGETVSEFPFIGDFALHRKDAHCTEFILLHNEVMETYLFATIETAVKEAGYPPLIYLNHSSRVPSNSSDKEAFIEKNKAMTAEVLYRYPDACILFFSTYSFDPSFLGFVAKHPSSLRRHIFMYTLTRPSPLLVASSASANVYASSFIPNYMNESMAVIKRARAAVVAAIARNTTMPPAMRPYLTGKINNDHIEGYIVGRMVVEIVRNTINVTREELINTAYNLRMQVDDFTLAPLTDKCQQGVDLPCFCNVAGKAYYMTRGNSTDGELYGVVDDADNGEYRFSQRTGTLSACLSSGINIRRPFNVLVVVANATAPGGDAARAAVVRRVQGAMRTALNARNRQADFAAIGGIHMVEAQPSGADNASMIAALVKAENRYRPFVVIGGEGAATAHGLRLDAWPATMRVADDAADAWQPNAVHLEAALAHYIHAQAANIGGAALVIADTVEMAHLAERSLHTFGHVAAGAPHITTGSGTDAATAAAATLVAGGRVLVATLRTDVLRAVLVAAEAAVLPNAAAQASAALRVATHETTLQDAVAAAGLTNASRLATVAGNAGGAPRAYFTSIHDAWWVAANTGAQSNALLAAFGSRASSDVARVKGVYYAEATYALAVEALNIGGGASGQATAAKSRSFTAAGVSIGPLLFGTCANAAEAQLPSRQCQCSAGPRRFALFAMADLLLQQAPTTASDNATRPFTMDSCGIDYVPLPAAATDRTAMIIGATAGGAGLLIALLAIAVVMVLCCGGRNHSAAPKDKEKPFTIVFSDIQSSTVLWARVPTQMSTAVDVHHAVMRKLMAKHKGYEVKTVGDSFMVAYRSVQDAVAFAVDIQRVFMTTEWAPEIDRIYQALALERAEMMASRENNNAAMKLDPIFLPGNATRYKTLWNGLRIRVGVHHGCGNIVKDETTGSYDYYGTVVNTAARIEGVGHGGQVLLSKDAYDAVGAAFLTEVGRAEVKPLGEQSLRGLDVPIELFQMDACELKERTFPALRLDIDHGANDAVNPPSASSDSSGPMHPNRSGLTNEVSTHSTGTSENGHVDNHHKIHSVAEAVDRKARNESIHPDELTRFFSLTQLLLATSPQRFQHDTLVSLMKRWHVADGAASVARHGTDASGATATAATPTTQKTWEQLTHEVNMVNLLAKVLKVHHASAWMSNGPPSSSTAGAGPARTSSTSTDGPHGGSSSTRSYRRSDAEKHEGGVTMMRDQMVTMPRDFSDDFATPPTTAHQSNTHDRRLTVTGEVEAGNDKQQPGEIQQQQLRCGTSTCSSNKNSGVSLSAPPLPPSPLQVPARQRHPLMALSANGE